MERDYSHRTTAQKLGIKEGTKIGLVGAPRGFAASLGTLPPGATISANASPACDLFIVVARKADDLAASFGLLAHHAERRQTVWVAWPKTASKVRSPLNGNSVRETGLAGGWVDFKVCSIDDTWSGLAFKRRK